MLGGETSQPDRSFLQSFILDMLKSKGIPVQALKMLPLGFGPQVEKLLFGNPYEAHTYFADMLYHVQQLLEQDKDWDPVEVVRRQEYAEAEKRARDRASTLTSSSRPVDGIGAYGEWKEHTVRPATFPLHDALSDVESADNRQQAEVQGAMVNGRSEGEQTL